MKKAIAILMLLILSVSILAACSDDGGGSSGENATLTDRWVHSWGYIYEFNEDGTGMWAMSEDSFQMNFIYEDKGNTLVITYRYEDLLGDGPGDGYFYDEPKELKYSIKGQTLSIEDNIGDMMEYKKQ